MASNKLTLSIAESCTGGWIQKLITGNPGVSDWFNGGITAYNIDIKTKLLDIDRDLAEKCNCVSKDIAMQMATGVAKQFNSDIGISTTGYVSNNDICDSPIVFIGYYICGITKYVVHKYPESDHSREQIQENFAKTALQYLLQFLIEMDNLKCYSNYDHIIKTIEHSCS